MPFCIVTIDILHNYFTIDRKSTVFRTMGVFHSKNKITILNIIIDLTNK